MKVAHHAHRLTQHNATAIFVAHDDADLLRRTMLKDVSSPFPVLVDLSRSTYRTWGLVRTSYAAVWLDPRVWARYARLMAAGERPRGLGRDTRQLGGDFVVRPDGIVGYARPQQRDDRPSVGRLLRVIEQEAGNRGT